jgi:hypothetical protein
MMQALNWPPQGASSSVTINHLAKGGEQDDETSIYIVFYGDMSGVH